MEVFQTWFCIVLDKKNHSKFICYTHRKNGMSNICLTDATDVWSTEVTEDTFKQSVGGSGRIALKSTVDYILNLRSACGQGGVSVVLLDSCAEVCVSSAAGDLSVTLPRLEAPRAPEEVKELLFRMAESKCGPPSVGPVKPDQWRPAEGQQSAAPAVTMKKRLPGTSLINPGTKRKRPATGVAFDEEGEEKEEE
ncbi:protein PAXX isoform X3 [Gymnodraco acuticeps]|uniref:Protein PAXX isoform X3 n=1 Tax=Gymnodraco acuticeps TaxID=8218 RepID=A0A6P8TJM4_GYMAC|nr:protein PAXX isoform X3 [Gymnodraco acuticeps]